MKVNKIFITTLIILIGIVVVSGIWSMFLSNNSLEAAKFYYFEKNLKRLSSFDQISILITLIIYGAKSTLLIILSIGIVQYLIAVPLGMYATNKDGLFKWIIIGLNGFFSRIPPIISAIIFINLPFLLFSGSRYFWAIFILAFIGVGQVSHRVYRESLEAYNTDIVMAGKKQGYRGYYLILYSVVPAVFPSIAQHFFKDLGKITMLLAQLGIFNILVTKSIEDKGHAFGELLNTDYNWTTMLGNTTKVIGHAPLAPLVPVIAFVLTILLFNLMGESIRSTKNKVESSTIIQENHKAAKSL